MSDDTPIVFVVDDGISVRESLKPFIRGEVWRRERFSSTQEFLDYIGVQPPDYRVVDVSLQDLNGLDLEASSPTSAPIFIGGE